MSVLSNTAEQVKRARSLLNGNYQGTIEELNSQMHDASKQRKYEEALDLRNQIASIRLLNQHQIVDNERRFDQDVMAFKQAGDKMLAVQMGVRKGVLRGKNQFQLICSLRLKRNF